jgi:sugar lactone lactonase YvrE
MKLVLITLLLSVGVFAQTTQVSTPQYIAIDSRDNLFVGLQYGIVRISPDGSVTNLTKSDRELDRKWNNLIIDSRDNLYANDGKLIYKFTFDRAGKFVGTMYAGQKWTYDLVDGPLATAGFNTIELMAIDSNDNIYVTDSFDKIKSTVGSNFVTDSFALSASAKLVEKKNRKSFSVIRRIIPNGTVSTLKTPDGKYILVNQISGMATDAKGDIIFGSYSFGRFVGKIDVTTGAITLVAGQPYKREYCPVYTQGPIATAEFVEPETIIVNRNGDIFVADQRTNRVMKIANGRVATIAGGNIIDPCSQNIAGRSQEGNRDGKALTALFNFPKGMAFDSKGNLFIADMYNHSVRKLSPDGIVSTFAK